MPKQTATAKMGKIKRGGRQQKRWSDGWEKRNWHIVARDQEKQDHCIRSQGPQRTVMIVKRLIIPPMLCTDYFIYLPLITTLGNNSVT
jgi:hypothetical protein